MDIQMLLDGYGGYFRMKVIFNPAVAGRALILRSLLRYNDVHFIPRQLAARWLIPDASGKKRINPVSGRKQTFFDEGIMQRMLRYIACFILIPGMMLVYPVCESSAQGNSSGSNVTSKDIFAPDFLLKDLNGRDIRLSDFKGKVILLYFMTTWCPDCQASIPYLKKTETQYREKGLIIININVQETQGKATAYAKKNSLPYPTCLDPEGTISRSYGVVSVPVKVLIDRDGRIICWNCRSLDKMLEKQFEKTGK